MMYIHGPLKWFYLIAKLFFFWVRPRKQTDTSYKDHKLITAVCGYCNHSIEQNDFNHWLGNHHTPSNPLVFKESLVDDRIRIISPDLSMEPNVIVPRWAAQYRGPRWCRNCGEAVQNTYSLKIMNILIVIFY